MTSGQRNWFQEKRKVIIPSVAMAGPSKGNMTRKNICSSAEISQR